MGGVNAGQAREKHINAPVYALLPVGKLLMEVLSCLHPPIITWPELWIHGLISEQRMGR